MYRLRRHTRVPIADAPPARDQISLPVGDALTLINDVGTLVDQQRGHDESRSAFIRASSPLAQRTSGPEFRGELPAEAAVAIVVDRLVERLVAQVPTWSVGILGAQPGDDLLGAPFQIELGLDGRSKTWLGGHPDTARTLEALPRSTVRQAAHVILGSVAPQLAADGRRGPAESRAISRIDSPW